MALVEVPKHRISKSLTKFLRVHREGRRPPLALHVEADRGAVPSPVVASKGEQITVPLGVAGEPRGLPMHTPVAALVKEVNDPTGKRQKVFHRLCVKERGIGRSWIPRMFHSCPSTITTR